MIINIKAKNIVEGWFESLKNIYENGKVLDSEIARDSVLVLEIEDISGDKENSYSDKFPMTYEEILYINQFLIDGTNEDKVIHEWTKLYRKRLVTESYNQIQEVINYLKNKPTGKRAQATVWDQKQDLYGDIGPCLQTLWFQVIDNKLDIHVHMRASDAYGKLLMNINEFAALQRYIADKLNIDYGKYYQFVDTCHINSKDIKK